MKGAEGGNDRVHELTAGKSRCGVASKLPRSAHLYNRKKGSEDQKSERPIGGGQNKDGNATYAQP